MGQFGQLIPFGMKQSKNNFHNLLQEEIKRGRGTREQVKRRGPTNNKFENDSVSSSSTLSTDAIQSIVDKLKVQRHRATTRKNYYGIWRSFNKFFIRLDKKPKKWEDRIVLFVGYLIENNRTINYHQKLYFCHQGSTSG